MRLLQAFSRHFPNSAPTDAPHEPVPAESTPSANAQSLLSRLDRLQAIADLDAVAAREIEAAEVLLDATLDECPSFYVQCAADRLRAARQTMSGTDAERDDDALGGSASRSA